MLTFISGTVTNSNFHLARCQKTFDLFATGAIAFAGLSGRSHSVHFETVLLVSVSTWYACHLQQRTKYFSGSSKTGLSSQDYPQMFKQ